MSRQDLEAALHAAIKTTEAHPREASGWSDKGLTFLNLERYEEALAAFTKVTELDDSDPAGWFNKGRVLLTSIAIIAGTAFLAGVFVLTDTIQRSFDVLFTDAYAKTDAWVRSSNVIEGDFGLEQRQRIPDSIVADVAAVPGVKQANANIMGVARITAPDGKDVGRDNGPPKFGGVFDPKDETSPWTLVEGKAAVGPDQVVIDKNTAKKGDIKVGDKHGSEPRVRGDRHRPLRRRRHLRRRHVGALRPPDGAGVRGPTRRDRRRVGAGRRQRV